MVGIYKKAKHLFKIVSQYAPFLNNLVPGLGEAVGVLSSIADSTTDGINNVYNDYNSAINSGETYGFRKGLNSFFRPMIKGGVSDKISVANTLSKEYGQLHPRLELKNDERGDF
jgi:hypothetical protein